MPVDLVAASADFRRSLEDAAAQRLADAAPERADLADLLRTYLNEVVVALELLSPVLDGHGPHSPRILEVGSGIGAVTHCLTALGYDVVGIEPGGPGFEDLLILQQVLAEALAVIGGDEAADARILPIGVEDLDPAQHGRFDVVLSVNVLEHVPDPADALTRIRSVVADGGLRRHVCPNYTFPYEPHFFVPLLPLAPALTRRLLPRRITDTGLWASLNFVTARRVRRWARGQGVAVAFDDGVLALAVERFLADPIFAERHAGLRWMVRLVERVGLVPVLRRLPAGWVSPMRFTIRSERS